MRALKVKVQILSFAPCLRRPNGQGFRLLSGTWCRFDSDRRLQQDVAQSVSAPALEAGGRRSESSHPDLRVVVQRRHTRFGTERRQVRLLLTRRRENVISGHRMVIRCVGSGPDPKDVTGGRDRHLRALVQRWHAGLGDRRDQVRLLGARPLARQHARPWA